MDQISSVLQNSLVKLPELVEYLQDHYVPHPCDCPAQSQIKQFLVAVAMSKLDSQFCKRERCAFMHVVPFVGPLHISLNGIEDLVEQYR